MQKLKTSHDAAPGSNRRSVFLFCAATFFFWAALYLYMPVLSVYTESTGASLGLVGVVAAAYAVPQLIFRVPMGLLSDAITRRKPMVAAGILMTLIGALGLGLTQNVWLLFLARAVTGFGGASWVIFSVYFTAYFSEEGMGRAVGVINFIQGIAMVAATFGGGLVAQAWGYEAAFYGAAGLGVVALVFLMAAKEPAVPPRKPASWQGLKTVALRPLVVIASVMGVLSQFAIWAGPFGFIPVYGAQLGASSADLGIISMAALAASAVASLSVERLMSRLGVSFTILLGAVFLGGTIFVVPMLKSVFLLETAMAVNGFGRGLLATILMFLSLRAVAPAERATAMGVYQAVYALGMLLGPLASGFLADSLGLAPVFYIASAFSFAIVLMVIMPGVAKHWRGGG